MKLLYAALHPLTMAKLTNKSKLKTENKFKTKQPKNNSITWFLTPNCFVNLHDWGVKALDDQRTCNDGLGEQNQLLIKWLTPGDSKYSC